MRWFNRLWKCNYGSRKGGEWPDGAAQKWKAWTRHAGGKPERLDELPESRVDRGRSFFSRLMQAESLRRTRCPEAGGSLLLHPAVRGTDPLPLDNEPREQGAARTPFLATLSRGSGCPRPGAGTPRAREITAGN
jgi:hypothetical protein